MVNYSQGKIYRVIPTAGGEPGDVYVGSTTKPYLSQRMVKHRSGYKAWQNGKTNYTSSYAIFDKYGAENCEIVLIEAVNASSLDELRARERYHIESMKCVNKRTPGQTRAEHYTANAVEISAQMKTYYAANRDHILERVKVYQATNAVQITARKKAYEAANRERINARNKARYAAKKGNAATSR
jgi:hypothetical protein